MNENPENSIISRLSGIEKASILLISLGADTSSNIMSHLTPDEIERLASEIVRLKKVDPDVREAVLQDSRRSLTEYGGAGGLEYAQEVLTSVFGDSKAKELLFKLQTGGGVGSSFRWLKNIPARQLAQLISNERPQVVTLIIAHLPPDYAGQIVSLLPEQMQGEIMLRLRTMQPTDPEVVKSLNQTLHQHLSSGDGTALQEVGGSESVIQILNGVDRGTERKIFEYLESVDEEVAAELKANMFVFEDIFALDDRSIQTILRQVPQEDLRLALKGAQEPQKQVFFKNMSQRAAETLQEDLQNSGPTKMRDVEAAQGRIVAIARELDESGEISLRDGNDDVVM